MRRIGSKLNQQARTAALPRAARTRRHCARGIAAALLFVIAVFAASGLPINAQSKVDEYKLKAAFVYHFAEMTDWPAEAFADNGKEITVCTLGTDPFEGQLESTLAGKAIGSRSLRVRHAKQTPEARGCQIVFLGSGDMKKMGELIAQIGSAPVMTIGEADGFLQQGGMFSFCQEGNKIRFEINVVPAERAGLKISSRLLLLAKNVMGSHGQS